jgi:putative intracellular protease/amidase
MNAKKTKIAIFLTEGFADWEHALLCGTGKSFYGLDIEFYAPTQGTLMSQGGQSVNVDHDFNEVLASDSKALVIVGGLIWETNDAPDINSMINDFHESGRIVAGICGGTLALARAKLLSECEHTSNDLRFLADNVPEYCGQNKYCESVTAVSSNRVITAAGTAPVSFTAAIFEAIGLDQNIVDEFRKMLAAEHHNNKG